MTAAKNGPAHVELAIRRAVAYELLARSVAYPDANGVAAMRELAAVASGLLGATPVAGLVGLAADASQEALEETYVRLFTLSTSSDCPTFETALLATDHLQQSARMADIAGFYRAFGVDAREPGFRPDDISVELEFMGYLCRKQAYAAEHLGAPRVNQVLRAQRLFLREHLGRWAGAIGRRMSVLSAPESFYDVVGRAIEGWVAEDVALINAGPVESVDIPELRWTRPDEEGDGPTAEADLEVIGVDDIPVI
jgi:TorA maturation chaperone TorD